MILDFGFWTLEERQTVQQLFSQKGITTELHYCKMNHTTWLRAIEKRNQHRQAFATKEYFVDENIKHMAMNLFEEPADDEVDVLIDHRFDE